MVTFFQDYRPLFMVVTFAFLGTAFYLTYRPRRGTRSDAAAPKTSQAKVMTFNKVMLWCVTAVALFSLFFPQAVTNLFASDDEFTPDMHLTVIEVKGMT